MKDYIHSFAVKLLVAIAIISILAINIFGQSSGVPTRTQCKGWDDAYLTVFHYSLVAGLVGSYILNMFSGIFGRVFWLFTSLPLRIIVVTLTCVAITVGGIALGPWTVGLGHWWFSGVDPRYFDCEGVQFGGEGLFGGLMGSGLAVLSQWPIMMVALSSTSILGGILAWLTSVVLNRWALGVPAKVKGEIG
jgi:hypothetical protein